MRFSVTFAVTLAAIAGSVIATPGPLYARALEQVNPFEPDEVDIYSRNNFHQLAAEKLESAINPTKSAIVLSQHAIDHAPQHEQERWMNQKNFHETMFHGLETLRDAHRTAAMQPGITPLFHMVGDALEHADDVAEHAKGVCLEAQQAVNDYKRTRRPIAVANDALVAAMHATCRAIGHTQRNIQRMVPDNRTIWTDRHAELQAMHSRLEEMHKAHKEGLLNSMDVLPQAAAIADQAKSLGLKARTAWSTWNFSNSRKNL